MAQGMERRKKRQEDDCGEQRVPVGLQSAEAVTRGLDQVKPGNDGSGRIRPKNAL